MVDTRPTQRELELTGSGTDAQHFTNGDKKCCVISPWRGDDVTSNNTGPLAAGSAVEGGEESSASENKIRVLVLRVRRLLWIKFIEIM